MIAHCKARHRHEEWLEFLRLINRRIEKGKSLDLIGDNYATHKHPQVKVWLKKHPHFHIHFTPTSASWLNRVERFVRSITVDRLRRGMFHSVADLKKAIDGYVNAYNKSPKPFVWTAQSSDILQKVIHARCSLNKTVQTA